MILADTFKRSFPVVQQSRRQKLLLSHQSCPTLCDPIPGILQARTLEGVAISFSNA